MPIVFDDVQQSVLDSPPNLIVTGSAGSGKTLLAIELARKHATNRLSVLVVTYTKSLSAFVKHNLEGIPNINVTHDYGYWEFENRAFDIIILDEAQDFDYRDITRYLLKAKKGCYIFGDDEQQLYPYNLENKLYNNDNLNVLAEVLCSNQSVKLQEISEIRSANNFGVTGVAFANLVESVISVNFCHIVLAKNYRSGVALAQCIQKVFPEKNFLISPNESGILPRFVCCTDLQNELDTLCEFLRAYKGSVGILLQENDGNSVRIWKRRKIVDSVTLGILELHNYLTTQEITHGYKYKSDEHLDFQSNINIMTYHSAKGLEFDCVYMPFLSFVGRPMRGEPDFSSIYVAMTRAKKQIIISYPHFTDEIFHSAKLTNNEIEGEIKVDIVTSAEWDWRAIQEAIGNGLYLKKK